MPLHQSAEMLLELMKASGLEFTLDADPQAVRANMELMTGMVPKHPVYEVYDTVLATAVRDISVRVYRPSDAPNQPLLVWLHGGGWVIGSVDSHDQLCRLLCDATGAMVVSVEYRLAPESTFPAAVEDSVAVWDWVNQHAADLGADPERIALGGDSAGGNLAAVTCLAARESGGAQPRLQLLVYPVTDYEFESVSMRDNGVGYFLEADSMRWFYSHYLRDERDGADWQVSPLRADDLSGVAPALVITAEYDPLRDQGEAYGRRLQDAGVPTEIVRIEGGFHGCFGMHDFVEPAREPWDKAIATLTGALGEG
ncbi:MAG: alpha/beta hydrolase [Actinomycetota bacterium]|nr:alpha/beta hydrolase [Actinomycetota bacterium]